MDEAQQIAPGIRLIPQFISPLSVYKLTQLAKDKLITPGIYDDKGNVNIDKTIRSHKVNNSQFKSIKEAEESPYQEFVSQVNFENISLLQVQVTDEGEFFDWHTDSVKGLNRKISVIIWLNDDFEGGETEFLTEEGVVGIKGAPGDAIFFESNIWHRGAPVTKGTKIISLGIFF